MVAAWSMAETGLVITGFLTSVADSAVVPGLSTAADCLV
eukprot:CAMPEP_0113970946 /NCGR_PEP_ID=MMETSP0011_2-20120614/11748_1 /TAXON_ID=101924 /ORGANISM="Rhodosorus marinus" /LENGTH=38 /DNA_ID=CAMNT_0000985957 /DNA_START=1422 /DNA_END=1538 /DNA_ORIENTATION=- /assembly_acc=CAM_ASM_000156